MQFCIENVSKSSGRLGQLIIGETGKQLKTPVLLQTTKGGSIPHLSREVFDYVTKDTQMLQLSLATMLRMAESIAKFNAEGGLSRYIGFPNYPTMLVMHDPCEILQGGHNEKEIVPIFTRHGKEQITAQRYMDLIECISPDIYVGLCDADTNFNSSKKRVQKSFDRTETFMDYCFERQRSSEKLKNKSTLFAPIVGGYSTYLRSKSIAHANSVESTNFGGYMLEGFHNYGHSATELNETELYAIVEHSMKDLNPDKPRMMAGAYTPPVLIELIRLGVDMFDTSYAYCATRTFKALTFCFDLTKEKTKDCRVFLDLTDESYKEDFTPFMRDCNCLACTKHTRAYVHHLYKTRELLGPILLMIHNLHHFMTFFEAIRSSIASDNLAELLKLVKFQNTADELSYRLNDNTKCTTEKTKEDNDAASISA